MKHFTRSVFSILALLTLSACSLLQTPTESRRFVIERMWVQSTLNDSGKGYAFAHQMAPALFDDLVYLGNSTDGLVAYDIKTGDERWRINVPNGVNSGVEREGDALFFGGSDGQFYSVDARNGKIRWTFPTRVENLAPPLVKDGVVYFLSGNNMVFALDSQTGRQKWAYDRAAAQQDISVRGGTKPGFYQGTLYVGFTDGFLVALNSRDGSMAWERQLNTNAKFRDVDSSPVVTDNQIFVASYDNALYCLSRSDGQVQWRVEEGASQQMTVLEDRVFVATSTGSVKALKKNSGDVLWSRELKGAVASQLIPYKGLVVFAESDGSVRFLEASNGQDVGKYESGWGSLAAPAIDAKHDFVFLGSTAGNLHALKVGWKSGPNLGPSVGR